MNSIAEIIENKLPPELAQFLRSAGEAAMRRGMKLYLAGGVVRDLLLGRRPNFDLDLVVEGDAISLMEELAASKQGKITTHREFNTATLRWGEFRVDLATARSETYAQPGALPSVKPDSIDKDLFRRDFTVNAMAVYLEPARYGEMIDPFGGRDDLEHRLIRILHQKSFIDDATRIWRVVRYEQRLGFNIEPETLRLLKQHVSYLDTISPDRVRHELELALKEQFPEKVLRRVGELGVLAKLHPALKGDDWLAERFRQARELTMPDQPHWSLSLALLAYRLSIEETAQLSSHLNLPKAAAKTIEDTIGLKTKMPMLAEHDLPNSGIYNLLAGYSPTAVTANLLAADSLAIRERIQLYLDRLRSVKPELTGEDLLRLGVPSGPHIKEILHLLLEARLDGKVASREEEEKIVKEATLPS